MRTIPIYFPAMFADIKDLYILQYFQWDLIDLYSHLVSRTRGDIDSVYRQTPCAMFAVRKIIVRISSEFEIVAIVINASFFYAVDSIGQHSIIVFSYNFHEAKSKAKSLLLYIIKLTIKEKIVKQKQSDIYKSKIAHLCTRSSINCFGILTNSSQLHIWHRLKMSFCVTTTPK